MQILNLLFFLKTNTLLVRLRAKKFIVLNIEIQVFKFTQKSKKIAQ
jgi:hypothetical protein